jgi:hypothetical protein
MSGLDKASFNEDSEDLGQRNRNFREEEDEDLAESKHNVVV